MNDAYIHFFERNVLEHLALAIPDVYHVIGNPLGQDLPPPSTSRCLSGLAQNHHATSTTKSMLFGPQDLPEDIDAPIDRDLLPKEIFWTSGDYLDNPIFNSDVDDPEMASLPENEQVCKTLAYLQYFNGNSINNRDAKEIRISLRRCFNGLLEARKKSGSKIAKSFTRLTFEERKTVRKQLYESYPYLRLCIGHFKVDRVAGEVYSQWKRQGMKDAEQEAKGNQTKAKDKGKKRASEESNEGQRKKHKTRKHISKSQKKQAVVETPEDSDSEDTSSDEDVIEHDNSENIEADRCAHILIKVID